MRYVVLIFGILGVAGLVAATFLSGNAWLKDRNILEVELNDFSRKQAARKAIPSTDVQNKVALDLELTRVALVLGYARQRTLPFILSGAILGLFGTWVSFSGRGLAAAPLLLLTGIVPGLLFLPIFLFSFCLIIAGLFSLFVRPRRPIEREFEDEPLND